jgi:hypothetical protein
MGPIKYGPLLKIRSLSCFTKRGRAPPSGGCTLHASHIFGMGKLNVGCLLLSPFRETKGDVGCDVSQEMGGGGGAWALPF